ncbi:COG2426 family protein [Caldalkalibacillus salinus]|uniref:COG2426 family protein n=1 Tax=Caldalkalibacillus salinus TaxID=2803787 RepID=UPI001923230D|nr:small multi-drug export protein [Caldalkalibacillus salinus]
MHDMKDTLTEMLLTALDTLPPELIVMIISCFPILELRGAIPIAMGVYHMSFWEAYVYGVVGNMLPVVPLLLLFRPLSEKLLRFGWYAKLYDWMYHRTMKKSQNIERFGAIGLILFTAVPLPTTGAWTACIAASLFKIRFVYAFSAIFIGVIIAGVVVGGGFSIFG